MQKYPKRFSLGQRGREKKWVLVAWEKICKPNSHGGLGLDDPEVLNKVLGAKFWWRWLKETRNTRAKIWKQKYAKDWQEWDHIRMTRHIEGSHIWNNAWENRALVQKHNFWEIKNGNLAWFWEDNWLQEPNLSREGLDILKDDTVNKGLKKVSDFWDNTRNNDKWRTWKVPVYNEETPLKTQAEALATILEKRKILISTFVDQLIWGRNSEGNHNLKEAKEIATGYNFKPG